MDIPGLLPEGGRAYRWSLLVALRPQSYRFISIRERKALEMRRENMASKFGGGSSRSQEGRRGKLHSTSEAKPTNNSQVGMLGSMPGCWAQSLCW